MKPFVVSMMVLLLACHAFGQIPSSGLIGDYMFTGNANDNSGGGFHGVVSGATLTADRRGNANSAYQFSSASARISLPSGSVGMTTALVRSISLWAKASTIATTPNNGGLLAQYLHGSTSQSNFFIGLDKRASGSEINVAGNGTDRLDVPLAADPTGQWIHIVVIMKAGTNNTLIYANGALAGSGTVTYNSTISSRSPIIGDIDGGQNTDNFSGAIDDLRIYNRALTSAEVLALYTEGNTNLLSTSLWEGWKWSGNNSIGPWFPTVDSVARFAIDDYSWGQVRTKENSLTEGTTFLFDVDMFLNSGGTNGDMAYFGFGSDWVYYSGNFFGIKFSAGQVYYMERFAGGSEVTAPCGTYTPGARIVFTITRAVGGKLIVASNNFNGEFTPSGTIANARCMMAVANATPNNGFTLRAMQRFSLRHDLPITAEYWEGAKWTGNVYQGSWFPSPDNTQFGIDDYSWGQLRTKLSHNHGAFQFDVQMYLNSGGTNGDIAYFGFGNEWIYYQGDFYGVKLTGGQVFYAERFSGGGEVTIPIGTYVPGNRVVLTIQRTTDGKFFAASDNFRTLRTPSSTLNDPRCIMAVANATPGHGFTVHTPIARPVGVNPGNEKGVVTEYLLFQNYPNPFNPSTTIRYLLPVRSHASLAVYNMIGQLVATLVNGEVEAGYHEVAFDGSGLASGVYFYRLQTATYVETKRLVLTR